MDSRPIIAITMGDAAGVGPEIVVKALALEEMISIPPSLPLRGGEQLYTLCRPLVVGDAGVLARARQMLELPVDLHPVADVSGGRFEPGSIDVLDLANIDLAKLRVGEVGAMAGRAAVEYVLKAGQLALAGEVQGIATGPLSK